MFSTGDTVRGDTLAFLESIRRPYLRKPFGLDELRGLLASVHAGASLPRAMLYVCIPSYNEAPTVGLLLWKIRQTFTAFPREYQLLVVDDASTDATSEVLEPYTRVLPLTVVRHTNRRGTPPRSNRCSGCRSSGPIGPSATRPS